MPFQDLNMGIVVIALLSILESVAIAKAFCEFYFKFSNVLQSREDFVDSRCVIVASTFQRKGNG